MEIFVKDACFHHYNTFGMCCDFLNTNLSINQWKMFNSGIFMTFRANILYIYHADCKKKNEWIMHFGRKTIELFQKKNIIQFLLFILSWYMKKNLFKTPLCVSSTSFFFGLNKAKKEREREKSFAFGWICHYKSPTESETNY